MRTFIGLLLLLTFIGTLHDPCLARRRKRYHPRRHYYPAPVSAFIHQNYYLAELITPEAAAVITDTLTQECRVKSAKVILKENKVQLEFNPKTCNTIALLSTLKQLGYNVSDIR